MPSVTVCSLRALHYQVNNREKQAAGRLATGIVAFATTATLVMFGVPAALYALCTDLITWAAVAAGADTTAFPPAHLHDAWTAGRLLPFAASLFVVALVSGMRFLLVRGLRRVLRRWARHRTVREYGLRRLPAQVWAHPGYSTALHALTGPVTAEVSEVADCLAEEVDGSVADLLDTARAAVN